MPCCRGRADGHIDSHDGILTALDSLLLPDEPLSSCPRRLRFFCGAVSGPRMCFMIDIEDSVLCDVGVNLRGGQVAMAE